MPTELKVPAVGESVTEVQIGTWLKAVGDGVSADEAVVEIESDKATVELPAPIAGVVARILKKAGETAQVGEVIGYLEEALSGASKPAQPAQPVQPAAPAAKGVATGGHVMPAAARAAATSGVDAAQVAGTGPGGRVLKEDVQRTAAVGGADKSAPTKNVTTAPDAKSSAATATAAAAGGQASARPAAAAPRGSRDEEVVPMTTLRRRIAQNLVEAQSNAALLTTFNEIDMTAVMELRAAHKDAFEKRHGTKLGFMSFFVKAAVDALRAVPAINAMIRGNDILYRHYHDIGIAVGGGKGLVVPVIRNAEGLGFAQIEAQIADFGKRAQANKITLEELTGGTFTISNGGIYGSLLSTPIVNPPQSGILGLHAIQERPMAVNGAVVIRPMMYVALTYDHRLVDGREAVTFLKRIKECIENPSRMLLEV
jgi:2-oxoglutarate dehydrogenase E2 component (dihydrolipoamide succinyltransferase)